MADGKVSGEGLVEESVFQTFDRLDKVVLDQIKRMDELEAATRSAISGSTIGSNADKVKDAVTKSNSALSEQEKVLREINRIRERNTQVTSDSLRTLAQERNTRSQITKALKDEAVISSTLTSSYQRLRKERDLAANTLRNLISSETASNRQLRRAQREFDVLAAKVRNADNAIGNFRDNVGNYGTAAQRVVRFSRELAVSFGVFSALQIGQEIFEQVKALDALKFGLTEVTESLEDFNRAQAFLDALADRAGADILVLTRRYTNFLAAAKTTNLTLSQTESVFENVVVAGSVLGRSTDDINGALRALEQILSKGKVQAEELRGQLGERLPGAFQILEKALGLASGELNELLEVGGVLSVEALPALAQGLEDTFNLDTIDRVETLASAQARLTNEITLFIRQLEEGGGPLGTFSQAVLDFLTLSVKGFTLLTRSQKEADEFFSQLAQQESFTDTLKQIAEEADRTGKSLDNVARELQSDFINQFNLAEAQVKSLREELQNNPSLLDSIQIKGELDIAIAKLNLYAGGIRAVNKILQEAAESTEDVVSETQEYEKTIEGLRLKLSALRKERDAADYEQEIGEIRRLNVEIKETEDLIKKLTDAYRKAREQQDRFISEDSIAFAKKLVSEFKKARDEVSVGSQAWLLYSQSVLEAEAALKDLEDTAAVLSGDLSSLVSEDDLNLAAEIDRFLNNEGLDVILQDFANRFKLSKEELLEEFIDLYGRDFDKFKEFEENKLKVVRLVEQQKVAARRATLDLADALSESFLEVQLNRLDEEEDRLNEVFDSIVNNKESSEEAIALAEQDRDANEKRLAAERQKRENQAFLFRQALSVGDILIADALARANAVASTAAIVPYLPLGAATLATLQALIGTNTALAIGTVLAQSVPKFFFKGKTLGDAFSGDAIWGELQREVKVGSSGDVEVSPDGPSKVKVKSSDIILPSMAEFTKQMKKPNSVVAKRVLSKAKKSTNRNFEILTKSREKFDTKEIEKALYRAVEKGLSKANLSPKFIAEKNIKVRRVP